MKIFRDGPPALTPGLLLLAAVYFLIAGCGLLRHEMWQDEMHHFLLARDSGSLPELFWNARFEGHPPLWNLLLYALVKLTRDPVAMQVLNLAIATLSVLVFLRQAPFAFSFKALFAGGYFMIYEYGIISRNYALSLLLLFTCCALLGATKKKYGQIVLCLVLLACSHLFALFCALPLLWLTARAYAGDENRNLSRMAFRCSVAAAVLVMGGILWSLVPAGGHVVFQYDTEPALSLARFSKAFSIFLKGFFPLPDLTATHWWNSNLFVEYLGPLRTAAALACLVAPAVVFYNRPVPFLFFYVTALCIVVFLFCSPLLGGVRYAGFVYILLVTALWLEKSIPGKIEPLPGLRWAAKVHTRRGGFLYAVLAVHVAAAAFAIASDWTRPFSEGKNVAAWLNASGRDKPVAVSDQTGGPAVSAYLGDSVFYPETNAYGSFCRWNTVPFLLEKQVVIERLHGWNTSGFFLKNDDSFGEGATGHVVFEDSVIRLHFVAKFDRAIVRTENYWLYACNRKGFHGSNSEE